MSGDIAISLKNFKERKILILSDDCGENPRAVLVSFAQDIKESVLNEMISIAHGLVYVVVGPQRVADFGLTKMKSARRISPNNESDLNGHCISVEAREGVSTGISIADRACTIRILGEEVPDKRKLVSPGHIFPVEARKGGVLVRNSLIEGALDVVSSLGVSDAAVMIDLLSQEGEFLNSSDQLTLSKKLELPLIKLSDIIRYKLEKERIVSRVAQTVIPSSIAGELKAYIFESELHGGEHLALVKGEIDSNKPVLIRVQTENTFADVFGGLKPSSRDVIASCLEAIQKEGSGVLLYLRKIEVGHLTKEISGVGNELNLSPDRMKEYGIGAQILLDLGVKKINLLTNSKRKLVGLNTFGIEIVATQAIPVTQASFS